MGLITREAPPPAVLDEGWVPDVGDWPELAGLRADHVRLRQLSRNAASVVRAIEERHEAEDEARQAAMREAFAAGDESAVPPPPSAEERAAELREANERGKAAYAALMDHCETIIATLSERGEEWTGDLDRSDRELDDEIRAAEAKLRALQRRVGASARLRHWIERTRGATGPLVAAELIAYTTIPTPSAEAGSQRWIEERMRRDFARSHPAVMPPEPVIVTVPADDDEADTDDE
jgi:hypothetical protein